MSATQPRRGDIGEKLGSIVVWTLIAVLLLTLLVTNLAERIALPGRQSRNPFTVTAGALHVPGTPPLPWGTGQTAVAAGFGLVLLAPVVTGLMVWARRHRRAETIDRAARHMGRGKDLQRLTRAAVLAVAIRLSVQGGVPGLLLGNAVLTRQELFADWESSAVILAGARVGKTTSAVIPWIMAAPGACLVTSNRRDVVDGTRGARPGTAYVFDPQQVVGETPTFYVDFLQHYVMSGPQGSEVKAQALAGMFADAVAPLGSRADRFFDPEGQALLGYYVHAAALDGDQITRVYEWLADESNKKPATILAAHGFDLSAKAVLAAIGYPEEQRGGVFATAKQAVGWLTNKAAVEWLTPGPGRHPFVPAAFAKSHDTLYLISREGRGTLAPLTTALAAAVCEAAEYVASRSPHGRLPTPMTCILDEVANVCRGWTDLPDRFSHYGGRGIFLVAVLQSWSQGEGVWGHLGMSAMWSTASLNVFLGGVRETRFLREISELVGTYRPEQVSTSHGRQGGTVNRSEGEESILSVRDLGALPRGRAVLLGSGFPPTLLRITQWKDTEWADAIKASYRKHDPCAEDTLAEAEAEFAEWDVAPAGSGWSR